MLYANPVEANKANVQPLSARYTRLIYIALTAPADSRQLQIEISPRCQVYKCIHANMNLFGILLHNPSETLSIASATVTRESFRGRDSAGRSETNNSGLVTSTQTPWDTRSQRIDTSPEKLHCSIKVVSIHLIQRFRDRYTQSICNLRKVGREHWIDWFWPFTWQYLLYTFSRK